MITRFEAESIAAQYVASMTEHCDLDGFKLVLTSEATIENDFGWVFFYNSNDPVRVPIAGNAPFIVERDAGNVLPTGTAYPIEHYIDNYRVTGDPLGHLGKTLRLSGFNHGARKIEATKALREHLGIGLGDAKRIVDDCIDGGTIEVTAMSEEDVAALDTKLKAALFVSERLPERMGEQSGEPEPPIARNVKS
ncbi:MAG: hypothetical protein AB7Q37_01920 [Pyrinomonadaceae bacterium]